MKGTTLTLPEGLTDTVEVSIQAVASNEANSSLFTDETVFSATLEGQVRYVNGKLNWSTVFSASKYAVKINNGAEIEVTSTSYNVVFEQKGTHTLSVCFYNSENVKSEWESVTVKVYEVTLSYNDETNTTFRSLYRVVGDDLDLPISNVNRVGYSFKNWSASTSGLVYDKAKLELASDLILYARWDANTYTAYLNYEGGILDSEKDYVEVLYDSQIEFPVAMSEDGIFAFGGWFTQPNGKGTAITRYTGESINKWNFAQPTVLYAYWVEIFEFEVVRVREASGDFDAISLIGSKSGMELIDVVTVPAVYNNMPVLFIESGAFARTSVKVINIPEKLFKELYSAQTKAIHNLCFVSGDFLKHFDCINYINTSLHAFSYYNQISLSSNVYLNRIYRFDQTMSHAFAQGKTSISDGECLLPISSINGCMSLLNQANNLKGMPNDFYTSTLAALYDACNQYAQSSFTAAMQKGFSGNLEDYKQYLSNFFINDYGEETYSQIALTVMSDYFNQYDVFLKAASAESKLTFYKNIGDVYLNPIGFFVPDYYYNKNNKIYCAYEGIVFNDRAYNKLHDDGIEGKYGLAVGILPDSRIKTKQLVDISPDNTYCYGVVDSIYSFLNMIFVFKMVFLKVLIIVGTFLTAFAVALMLNLISVTIVNSKRQIGILRAMGAKSGDVFRIFSIKSIFIAFVNFVISVLGTLILVGVLNAFIKKTFEVTATILVFSFRQVVLLFVISFFAAVLGSLFPILKITRKKPIEVISQK